MSGQPSLSKSAAAAPMPYEPIGRQSLLTNTIVEGPRGRAMPDCSDTSANVPSPRLRYRMFVPPAKPERTAGHRNLVVAAVGGIPWQRRAGRIEVHVVGDEQIEPAVAVVVEETAAGAPAAAGARHAGLFGHIGERAVAVVVVEHVPAPIADEQIVEAVVVVVADAASLAPSGMGQPGLLRDVGKGAVAIVVKEVAGGPARRALPDRSWCRSPGRCPASRRCRSRRTRRRRPFPRAGTACPAGCRRRSRPARGPPAQ